MAENIKTENNPENPVSVKLRKPLYSSNETLKRFIYIQHKSNINQFAKEVGVARQTIWGIITGRLRASMPLARRICDLLQVQDTRLIFPDGALEYPKIVSASEYSAEIKGEQQQLKDTAEASQSSYSNNGEEKL